MCECFCVCVFGYKERLMCGLWAVMEDPVSLMWWILYSLYTINGTHSSTELSSVQPVFMSRRWRYKREKGSVGLVFILNAIRCIIFETFSAGPRMKADWWKEKMLNESLMAQTCIFWTRKTLPAVSNDEWHVKRPCFNRSFLAPHWEM